MTTVYLIRHGETELNRKKLVQGWSDSNLTKSGIEVVKETGVKLENIYFKYIFTSDLSRTYKTANIILDKNKLSKDSPLVKSRKLREMNFGKFESKPNNRMARAAIKHLGLKSFVLLFNKRESTKKFVNAISEADETGVAENYEHFSKRVFNELKNICEKSENEENVNILIVVHGLVISVLLNEISDFSRTSLKNASISKVHYDKGSFKVISVNF